MDGVRGREETSSSNLRRWAWSIHIRKGRHCSRCYDRTRQWSGPEDHRCSNLRRQPATTSLPPWNATSSSTGTTDRLVYWKKIDAFGLRLIISAEKQRKTRKKRKKRKKTRTKNNEQLRTATFGWYRPSPSCIFSILLSADIFLEGRIGSSVTLDRSPNETIHVPLADAVSENRHVLLFFPLYYYYY